MLNYPAALRSAGIALLLSLAWYALWISVYLFLYDALEFHPLADLAMNFAAWLSVPVAVFSFIWTLSTKKPHLAYAGLHVFWWVCFLTVLVVAETPLVLIVPLVISLLLFIFLQPLLALLSRWYGLGIPKQPEAHYLYEDGYRAAQPEAVYREGEGYYPYPAQGNEQVQYHPPQISQ